MNKSRILLLVAGFALGSLVSAHAAIETYEIDPAHTRVGFSIGHFFTPVPGYFGKVKGQLIVDRDHLERSTVEAVIAVASLTTNTPMRDEDLRSTNFFDATKYPAMTFRSKAWRKTGANTYAVTGDLTIRSVTRQVVLTVVALGFGPGMKDAAISGWEVSSTLDRRDFDLSADAGMIANNVEVLIHVEADLR